jgi:hypothetical protein
VKNVVRTGDAAPTTSKLVIVCWGPAGRVDETALSLGSRTKVVPDTNVAEVVIGRLRRYSVLAKQRRCLRCMPDELRTE